MTYSERVVSGVVASLSAVGALVLLTTILFERRLRKRLPPMRIIAALAFSHLGLSIGVLAGERWCRLQGFLLQFFVMAASLWGLVLAYVLRRMVAFRPHSLDEDDDSDPSSMAAATEAGLHAAVWATSVALASVPLLTHDYEPNEAWCWITPSRRGLRIGLSYGPTTAVFGATLWLALRTRAEVLNPARFVPESKRAVMRALLLYVLAFAAVQLPSVVHRVAQAAGYQSAALSMAQSATLPAQGLAACLCYMWSISAFRRYLGGPAKQRPAAAAGVAGAAAGGRGARRHSYSGTLQGPALTAVVLAYLWLASLRATQPHAERELDRFVSPLLGMAARSAAGAALLGAVLVAVRATGACGSAARPARWAMPLRSGRFVRRVAVMGALQCFVPVVLASLSRDRVPRGLSLALVSAVPLLTAVARQLALGGTTARSPVPFRAIETVGTVAGLAGGVMLGVPQFLEQRHEGERDGGGGENLSEGIALLTAAAALWAAAAVYNRAKLSRYGELPKACAAQAFASVYSLAAAAVFELGPGPGRAHFSLDGGGAKWFAGLTLGISAAGVLLEFHLFDVIGPVRAGSVYMLVAPAAVLGAAALDSEWSGYSGADIGVQMCGVAVVFAGLALVLFPSLYSWYDRDREESLGDMREYLDGFAMTEAVGGGGGGGALERVYEGEAGHGDEDDDDVDDDEDDLDEADLLGSTAYNADDWAYWKWGA